jgi:glyoxylase-like metal-dependent hydrolase (beta-lactamase superfamily II)
MTNPFEIIPGIYCVGGSDLSHPQDALAYLIKGKESAILIDSGAGKASETIWNNIQSFGVGARDLSCLILTHAHVDHIGGARYFKEKTGCRIAAHRDDQEAIESGDPVRTAASWYGTNLPKLKIDRVLNEKSESLPLEENQLICLHTPGHTPGSLSPYIDWEGKRVLFGQDIHGPFSKAFLSNLSDWRTSMENLLELKADILCEGHFGIYRPQDKVQRYIGRYLEEYLSR